MPKSRWTFAALTACALLLAGLVHYPALQTDLISDDFLQNEMLDGTYAVRRSPLDLFTFAVPVPGEIQTLREHGDLPWWSHPRLRLSAFRPFASLTIVFDHALGLSVFARHVQSLGWWIAMVAAFALLSSELMPFGGRALSVFLFALNPARIVPLAWLANRSSLMCALFGILGLYGHVRNRRGDSRFGQAGPLALFACTLLSGEYGLSVLGYVVAYELCIASDPFVRKVKSLLPLGALVAIYFLCYSLLGFGPSASSLYTSPTHDPKVFFADMIGRFPALLGDSLLLWPAFESHVVMWLNPLFYLLLVVTLAALGLLIRSARSSEDRRVAKVIDFAALGLFLSLVPLIGTVPSTRLLLIPSIGASLLIGTLVWEAGRRLRSPEPASIVARVRLWARVAVTGMLAFRHYWGATERSWLDACHVRDDRRFIQGLCDIAEIDDSRVEKEDLVLLGAMEPETLLYVPNIRHEHGSPMPRSYMALSTSFFPVRVRQVAPDTLEIFVTEGTLLDNPIASAFRRQDLALLAGDTVHMQHLDIEVMEDGPRRVRFRFDRPLADPSLRFLALTPIGIRKFLVPPPGAEAIAGVIPALSTP